MSERLDFTAADGTILAGECWRGAGPAIVLLHAGVADRRAWSEAAAALHRAGHDVVAYDRRGFGETPPAAVADHVGDLRNVLEQAGAAPAWLVGNSQGGQFALDLALADPALVAGLVLIAPAVSGAPEPDDADLDAATLRIDADIEAAAAAGDLEAVNRHEIRLWLDGPVTPEGRVGGALRELALAMNAIALAAADVAAEANPPAEPDTWERLGEVACPATVAFGELDLPFFAEQSRALAERLPGAGPAIELPGVAHLPGLEQPAAVADLIREAIVS